MFEPTFGQETHSPILLVERNYLPNKSLIKKIIEKITFKKIKEGGGSRSSYGKQGEGTREGEKDQEERAEGEGGEKGGEEGEGEKERKIGGEGEGEKERRRRKRRRKRRGREREKGYTIAFHSIHGIEHPSPFGKHAETKALAERLIPSQRVSDAIRI